MSDSVHKENYSIDNYIYIRGKSARERAQTLQKTSVALQVCSKLSGLLNLSAHSSVLDRVSVPSHT